MDTSNEAGVENNGQSAPSDTGVENNGNGGSAGTEDNTDWKALAEQMKTERDNYRNALSQKRQLRTSENTENNGSGNDDVASMVRKAIQEEVLPAIAASKEDTLLSSKITDHAKRAVVKQILETRIVRTGADDLSIANDIDEAIALADSKANAIKITELARVAADKGQTVRTGGTSSDDSSSKKGFFSKEQEQQLRTIAQQRGFDPDKFVEQAAQNAKK